jgi:catalase
MTMINTPMFFAAMPRTFLDKMLALKPDPATGKPDPAAIRAFVATHPDAAAQTQFLAANNPPPSYANTAYYGIHTFKFINRDNKATLVRWRFVPQDGEKQLSDAELSSLPLTVSGEGTDRPDTTWTCDLGHVRNHRRAWRAQTT